MSDPTPKTLGQIAYESFCEKKGNATMWPLGKGFAVDEMNAWEAVANAVLDEAAKVADYWGDGKWRFQPNGRARFAAHDMQTSINTTGRGIAEDIRALKTEKHGGRA